MSRRLNILGQKFFPAYVVWELTLRCDQQCTHCGSRAKSKRPNELSRSEALRVAQELVELSTREVILIGGEAYLHDDFLDIVKALKRGNIEVGLTSGGRGIDHSLSTAMKDAGINRVSISIDGLSATHDLLRANKGSFERAVSAIRHLKAAGIRASVNTTINRVNKSELEQLYDLFRGLGVSAWQVQILAPLGRASDRPDMLLEPYHLLDIIPRLAKLKAQAFADNILIMPGNNLGYFGPDEAILRSLTVDGKDYFAGCQAGRYILGIESDGTIKGCPSLQTSYYAAGSVKDKSLFELWTESENLAALRENTNKELWGFCKACPFSKTCQAGCTFTAHALFGKAGNNPYCFFRAQTLAKQGLRERLNRIALSDGTPFDHALFEIVVEELHAKEASVLPPQQMVQIRRKLHRHS